MTTEAEALALLERVGERDDRWAPPFIEACNLLEAQVGSLRHADLARLLLFIEASDCYYHQDICTLKHALLKEAAARLTTLVDGSSRPIALDATG